MIEDANPLRAIGAATIGALVLHACVDLLCAALIGDDDANFQQPARFVVFGTAALAVLFFFVWVSRAHAAARAVSSEVRYERVWVLVGFFAPFLNLVHPYRVVSDVWRALTRSDPATVRVWWFGSLGLLLVHRCVALVDPASRVYVQASRPFVNAALCIMTAYVVWRIGRARPKPPATT